MSAQSGQDLEVKLRLVGDAKNAQDAVKALGSEVRKTTEAATELAKQMEKTGGAGPTAAAAGRVDSPESLAMRQAMQARTDQAATKAAGQAALTNQAAQNLAASAAALNKQMNTSFTAGALESAQKRKANEFAAKEEKAAYEALYGKERTAAGEAGSALLRLAGRAAVTVTALAELGKTAGNYRVTMEQGFDQKTALSNAVQDIPLIGSVYKSMQGAMYANLFTKSMADLNNQERFNLRNNAVTDAMTPSIIQRQGGDLSREQRGVRRMTPQGRLVNRAGNRQLYGDRFDETFNAAEYSINQARREAAIAGGSKEAAAAAEQELAERSQDRRGQVAASRAALKKLMGTKANPGSDDAPAILAAYAQMETAQKDYAAALEKQKAAGERLTAASLDEVTKRRELAAANTALVSATRDMAKTRLDESKNAVASFGAMTAEDQYMLFAAARQLKAGGVDSLAPEQRQLLLSNEMTSEETRKQLIQSTQKSPLVNSILSDVGRGSIVDQEKEVARLNAQYEVRMQLDRGQFEEAIRKVLDERGINAEDISQRSASLLADEIEDRIQRDWIGKRTGLR